MSAYAAAILIAQQNGYFKDAGVNVNVEVVGSVLTTTDVAAGRVDLAVTGATSSFPPALQGHATEIVDELVPDSAFTSILVPYNSPIKSLMDLSGKKITVVGVGSATYGAVLAYSNYVTSHGGKPITPVPVTDATAQVSQVLSGQATAAIGLLDTYASYLGDNKVRVLNLGVDQASQAALNPSDVVGSVFWGLQTKIGSDSVGVSRFVAGIRRADTWLDHASASQIASVLAGSPVIPASERASISAQVPYDKPLYSASDGYISAADWKTSLSAYASWHLPNINVNDDRLSYANHVNMDFWNKATSLVNGS
ncbi:MAG TPA: ABC transporter substrate-binding protein [Streptosporangiaceae bacterium]